MVSLPQAQRNPPSAGCGTCTHCCDAVGVIELGKPFYARCPHLNEQVGCGIYEARPTRCRSYRCAWHLGLLGEDVKHRPDNVGLLIQFEAFKGRWHLGIFEVRPGALGDNWVYSLIDMILSNGRIAHLVMADPPARFYPYGADIPPDYPLSETYRHYAAPTPPMSLRREAKGFVFSGKRRGLLMPLEKSDTSK